ncbi:hypothetical protein MTR67_052549 [Solanum verrucosum]|uniref:Uncharacterized protein n=1 Tax=Solanum verrucosum TaxID=315347 RepID=A0AAF1A3L6_SOLVR|nr:hypothetical protein MTR67_052549 [Solanum verrucosum]
MEFEASHRHQKMIKHTSSAPFSASSIQDSTFTTILLPKELITEIHLRLPVKPLLRFRLILGFDPPENNLKDCSLDSLLYDHVTRAIDLDYPPKKSYESIKEAQELVPFTCMVLDTMSFAKVIRFSGYYKDCVILVVDLADGRWEEMENPYYREEKFDFTPYLGVFGNGLFNNQNVDSMSFPEVSNCGQLADAKFYIESLVWPFVAEHTRNATTPKSTKS